MPVAKWEMDSHAMIIAALGIEGGFGLWRRIKKNGKIGSMDMEGLTNMKLGIERRMRVMEKNGEIGGMDMERVWRQGMRQREEMNEK
ncbi:hypothetical protein ACFX2J_045298 [Malus domestica]